MHFLILGVKCFLGHNFGSRHARRSNKSSIDAGDYLVSTKSLSQNFGLLAWCPVPVKFGLKNKNTPTLRAAPRRTPHLNQKIFLNRTKKTCCIRRGFVQLSSYSDWRVITKKARTNLLARAVVKGSEWNIVPSLQIIPDALETCFLPELYEVSKLIYHHL